MLFQPNFCFATDFYKLTHWKQYPSGMNRIVSYCEAREGAQFDEIVFCGLIPILKEYFEGIVITKEKIDEAEELTLKMGGQPEFFNRGMWEHIVNEYHGKLPLRIRALEEGTVVRPGIPMFVIESIGGEKTFPLVNHSETLLMHVWNAITVASASRYIKKSIEPLVEKTGTMGILPFMVHDFGFRGVSSFQTAVHAGIGHLINFNGTDTNEAVRAINHFYPGSSHFGGSVWATEHSVATSFGPGEKEKAYLKHQLVNAPNQALISVVMDSYNTYNFASGIAAEPEIKKLIIEKEGRVVFRPDSGDPKIVVPKLLDILGGVFGYEVNDKGYKVIKHNVGVIQGDGMDVKSIPELYQIIVNNGWSTDNLVVGSGGGLLQKWNRDTLRFAIKACYGEINGEGFDIFKDPVTANTGADTKVSKKGNIKVQEIGNLRHTVITTATEDAFNSYADSMKVVYELGEIKTKRTFDEIRLKAAS